jgi:Transmembrane secretion effector
MLRSWSRLSGPRTCSRTRCWPLSAACWQMPLTGTHDRRPDVTGTPAPVHLRNRHGFSPDNPGLPVARARTRPARPDPCGTAQLHQRQYRPVIGPSLAGIVSRTSGSGRSLPSTPRRSSSRPARSGRSSLSWRAAASGSAQAGNGLRSTVVVVIVLVPTGMVWVAMLATVNTLLQLSMPPWLRARGLSVYQTVLFGAQGLGAVAWGALEPHRRPPDRSWCARPTRSRPSASLSSSVRWA